VKDYKLLVARLTNSALLGSGAALLAFGLLYAYRGNSTLVAVCIAGAILLIFSGTIERFESIKGLGVEAKTRQLNEKLVEADRAIDQLRQLAETLGTESVAANSRLGRLGSAPTVEESYMHAQEVRAVMLNLGSKPEVVRAMLKPFIHMMLFDMASGLLHSASKNLTKQLSDMNRKLDRKAETPEEAHARSLLQGDVYEFQRVLVKDLYANLAIEGYPNEILARLSRVPLLDEQIRQSTQGELLQFAGEMLLLRSEGRLENPEAWFAKVKAYRDREGHLD
jgi:hypothetical protein